MCAPYTESQKMFPRQRRLDTRSRLCFHRIAGPRKPTPRIKQRVASYHTTKVIAHKASYSKLRPKIGCHGNVPQHCWTPSNTIPMANPSSQPKRHLDRFSHFCTDDRTLSYTLHRDALPPQNCPFRWGYLDPGTSELVTR